MSDLDFIAMQKIPRLKMTKSQKGLLMSKAKYAWCAGFFDGEGSTGFYKQISHGKYVARRLVISIAQVNKSPLLRFKNFIGDLGSVTGPYGPYTSGRQAYYSYAANGTEAKTVLNRLWPFLSVPKKTQAKPHLKSFAKSEAI